MNKIHTPLALKLHAYGLRNLHDPNWTGMELYDHLKQHIRGRIKPTDLLQKTLKNGLLYHVGMWLFEEYVLEEGYFLDISEEV